MEKIEEAKLRIALLKENFEYQNFFIQFLEADKNSIKGVWPGLGFNKFGLTGLRFYIAHPFYQYDLLMDLINPQKDQNALPLRYINLIPKLFHEPSVKLIEVGKRSYFEGGTSTPIWIINERGLNPWERLYQVDLTKNKSLIMKEFKQYIENAISNRTADSDWDSYKKRSRSEAWIHLAVWKFRKERKLFSIISKELGITIDAAKKSFYRAYELTQGKKYDAEMLKKEIWRVKITDIAITCDACPKRKGCDVLCPDILKYVDQDQAQLHEKFLPDDSDTLRDYLIQKNS